MCQRLIEYHKKEAEKMTAVEVGATVTVVTAFLSVFAWLKNKIDSTRKDHAELAATLAKEYMDKEETLKMYGLMSESTDVKIDNLEKSVTRLESSNADHFKRLYKKIDDLAK